MEKAKLTVLFDPPFWVGLFERERAGGYEACKVTFGAEPKDQEIYAFVLDRYCALEFSPALPGDRSEERPVSPKRAQRLAGEQTRPAGMGTKAQQALQLQRERTRAERKVLSREAREAEERRRFQLRREKRKEKQRGR